MLIKLTRIMENICSRFYRTVSLVFENKLYTERYLIYSKLVIQGSYTKIVKKRTMNFPRHQYSIICTYYPYNI